MLLEALAIGVREAALFYVGDRKPGQVLCQNVKEFGGLWLVVRASGKLVR